MIEQSNRMVEEYLEGVARATADLPPQQRYDLLADLREHIVASRAELQPETQSGVREILDKLGDPETIAAEARLGRRNNSTSSVAPPPKRRLKGWVVVALVALVALGVLGVAALAGLGTGPYLVNQTSPSVVPAILGLRQPDADAVLRQAKLHGSATLIFDSTCVEDTVVRQNPPPGFKVAPNSTITYDVCGGPRR